jgi:hypothetical protein
VRRQARQVPDIVCRPLEASQIKAPTVKLEYDDIATCDDTSLLPDLRWEHEFLQDFSAIRSRVDKLRPLCKQELPPPAKLPSSRTNASAWKGVFFGENSLPPSLGLLLRMDSVAVNGALWALARLLPDHNDGTSAAEEGVDSDGMPGQPVIDPFAACWIYALLAVTDRPADPDTGAALRSLLRCLCALRARCGGLEVEEKGQGERRGCIPALNILITILGRYFGQMPARSAQAADEEQELEQEQVQEDQEEWAEEEDYVEEEEEEEEENRAAREQAED